MQIPDSFIEDLLARIDIVELVGQYVELKKHGANYTGLCPFHNEKSPSFSVSPSKQFYHCFGCGVSGDAIQFLIDYNSENFHDAIEHLASRCGLTLPQQNLTPQAIQQQKQRKQQQLSLLDYLQQASDVYQNTLRQHNIAIDYLKNRGVSGAIAKQFAIGYAPEQWNFLTSALPDSSVAELVGAGLLIERENEQGNYDRFRQRIMFPIRNVRGETIGFGGRILGDGQPKYLNSPETAVFSKGKELYGIFEAKQAIQQKKYALVCEGYMDVIALAQHDFANAVATLGTACSADHLRLLLRFTKNIVFAFDGDKAGRAAAEKAMQIALPLADDDVKLKFLFLPTEHDPDSYIRQYGAQDFEKAIQQAQPLSKFLLDFVQNQQDLSISENRASLLSSAKPLWQSLPAGAFKQQLLSEIVKLSQLSAHEILGLWKISNARQQPNQKYQPHDNKVISPLPLTTNSRRWQQILYLILSNIELWDRLTAEEQTLLYQLEPPFGSIFAWLSSQILEFGQQPWAVLRNKLKNNTAFKQIEQIMDDNSLWISVEEQDPYFCLRPLINNLMIDQLKQQEAQALAEVQQNPQALQRYRLLQKRRNHLTKNPH